MIAAILIIPMALYNKVHHVTTINRVAKDLGENEGWLFDVANEMDVEDDVIWVYGVGDDGVMAGWIPDPASGERDPARVPSGIDSI